MNTKQIWSILVFTVLELRRTRIWVFVLISLSVVYAAASFSAALALTESNEFRLVVLAALGRLAVVMITIIFVASATAREFDDKVFDLVSSRAVTRASWFIGKFSGYIVFVGLLAALFGSIVAVHQGANAFVWGISLFLELTIISTASLTFVIALRQPTMAIVAVIAFYALCRVITPITLMSSGSLVDLSLPVNRLIRESVNVIAHLLPDIGSFTQSAWLLRDSQVDSLGPVITQSIIYCGLLIAVGLFDLHRRNF